MNILRGSALRGSCKLLTRPPFKGCPRAFCDHNAVEKRAEKFCIPRAEVEKRDKWQMAAMASKAPGVDGIMAGGSPMVDQREPYTIKPAVFVTRKLLHCGCNNGNTEHSSILLLTPVWLCRDTRGLICACDMPVTRSMALVVSTQKPSAVKFCTCPAAHVAALEDLKELVEKVDAFIFDCDGEFVAPQAKSVLSDLKGVLSDLKGGKARHKRFVWCKTEKALLKAIHDDHFLC